MLTVDAPEGRVASVAYLISLRSTFGIAAFAKIEKAARGDLSKLDRAYPRKPLELVLWVGLPDALKALSGRESRASLRVL